ncbi:MAG: OB-fold nucleic acid binding domain-containing protein, partial [Dehalococcoidia bacterium]
SDVDFGVRTANRVGWDKPAAGAGPPILATNLEPETTTRSITFGLSAIKGCGGQAASALIAERNKNGPFRDLFDFCERVDPALCNRATIESLIKAGAFDFTFQTAPAPRRSQLTAVLDRALQTGAALLADRKSGQKGLFDDAEEGPAAHAPSLPDLPEWNEKEKLAAEKEVLGFYLTSHPLAEHEQTLSTYCSHNTAAIASLPARTEVVTGGMIGAIKHSQTKNPRAGETNTRYAMFDLEDIEGMIRCILWPSDFVNYGQLVADGAIVALRGSIDRRPGSDEANLIVNEIFPLSELAQRYTRGIRIRLDEAAYRERAGRADPVGWAEPGEAHGPTPLPPRERPGEGLRADTPLPLGEGRVRGTPAARDAGESSTQILDSLNEILRGYPGTCEVELALVLADGAKLLLKCNSPKVQLSPELRT